MVEEKTLCDRVYETLVAQPSHTAPVAAIAVATGLENKQVATALAAMARKNNPRVERLSRGAYRAYRARMTVDEIVEDIETKKREYVPPSEDALERGRVRKIRGKMAELDALLGDLDRYITKLEAKGRAYDKIQLAINGVVVDPL